jgi:hypothetical protein
MTIVAKSQIFLSTTLYLVSFWCYFNYLLSILLVLL